MKNTWVLVDKRAGNSNQCRALANLLELNFSVKHLEYNLISTLPNFIKHGLIELTKQSKDSIFSSHDVPDIIISSGRRMASVAVALKSKFPKAKLLQIMNPGLSLKHFDALIFPEHDKKPSNRYLPKTAFITGALSYYPADQMAQDKIKWSEAFAEVKFKTPVISVLIGGKSKGCDFTMSFAVKLLENLSKLEKDLGASVFISTSRRTPHEITNFFHKSLPKYLSNPYIFFDPYTSRSENPYKGFLALADYIVVTGDSISMCSEASITHKPTYIYYDEKLISNKHLRFIYSMFSNNHARPFSDEFEYFRPNAKANLDSLKLKIDNVIHI